MTPRDLRLLRASLVAVWLATALASVLEAHGRGAALLQAGGVQSPVLAAGMLWGGIGVDALVGLLLWRAPLRMACSVALSQVAVMTIITTALLPTLWLDPLGALTKNLPIVAILVVLRRRAP